nr:MAG TPA: PGDYG protein [Caudoviricetes sp.]
MRAHVGDYIVRGVAGESCTMQSGNFPADL